MYFMYLIHIVSSAYIVSSAFSPFHLRNLCKFVDMGSFMAKNYTMRLLTKGMLPVIKTSCDRSHLLHVSSKVSAAEAENSITLKWIICPRVVRHHTGWKAHVLLSSSRFWEDIGKLLEHWLCTAITWIWGISLGGAFALTTAGKLGFSAGLLIESGWIEAHY